MLLIIEQKEASAEFLADYGIHPSTLKETFIQQFEKFESDPASKSIASKESTRPKKRSCLDEEIYGDPIAQGSVTIELNRYLGEIPKDYNGDVLQYWKERASAYPGLARMAWCYLAIPAASAPSEWVFSKAKAVLTPQRSSLSSRMVEALVCLKDWFWVFGAIYTGKD